MWTCAKFRSERRIDIEIPGRLRRCDRRPVRLVQGMNRIGSKPMRTRAATVTVAETETTIAMAMTSLVVEAAVDLGGGDRRC